MGDGRRPGLRDGRARQGHRPPANWQQAWAPMGCAGRVRRRDQDVHGTMDPGEVPVHVEPPRPVREGDRMDGALLSPDRVHVVVAFVAGIPAAQRSSTPTDVVQAGLRVPVHPGRRVDGASTLPPVCANASQWEPAAHGVGEGSAAPLTNLRQSGPGTGRGVGRRRPGRCSWVSSSKLSNTSGLRCQLRSRSCPQAFVRSLGVLARCVVRAYESLDRAALDRLSAVRWGAATARYAGFCAVRWSVTARYTAVCAFTGNDHSGRRLT